MRKWSILLLALTVAAVWTAYSYVATASAQEKGQKQEKKTTAPVKQHEYVGVSKCKICHKREAGGDQYGKWESSMHAKAYATLGTDEAKKIAAKVGIKGDPQQAEDCIRCHVTAAGVAADHLGAKYSKEDGVTCEACHGAGGDYMKMSVMKGLMTGKVDPASVGLVMPTKETCVGCHNDKSPTFAGFDYDKYFAKIAHPIPAAEKAKYKTSGGGSK